MIAMMTPEGKETSTHSRIGLIGLAGDFFGLSNFSNHPDVSERMGQWQPIPTSTGGRIIQPAGSLAMTEGTYGASVLTRFATGTMKKTKHPQATAGRYSRNKKNP